MRERDSYLQTHPQSSKRIDITCGNFADAPLKQTKAAAASTRAALNTIETKRNITYDSNLVHWHCNLKFQVEEQQKMSSPAGRSPSSKVGSPLTEAQVIKYDAAQKEVRQRLLLGSFYHQET